MVGNSSKSNQQVLLTGTLANTLSLYSLNSNLSFFGSTSFFHQLLLLLIAFDRFVEVSFLLQVSVSLSIKPGSVLTAHSTFSKKIPLHLNLNVCLKHPLPSVAKYQKFCHPVFILFSPSIYFPTKFQKWGLQHCEKHQPRWNHNTFISV